MNRLRRAFAATLIAAVALTTWSCSEDQDVNTPVNKPTIGIMEPEFDAEVMVAKVMIAPSTDATAWYWCVVGGSLTTELATYTKVEGATAKEVEFEVVYGIEYTIKAYAENKAGSSEVAEKRFCAMPEGEVTLTIGEITIVEESATAEATIYPSKEVTQWYWKAYPTGSDHEAMTWNAVEGNKEQKISFKYEWNKEFEVRAYGECGIVKGKEVTATCTFKLAEPTITVSKPMFDEEKMEVSFEVTPSDDTNHWYWGTKQEGTTTKLDTFEDATARTVSCKVAYDTKYEFIFRAENLLNEGEEKSVEFSVIGPVAEIAIENLTAFTIDAVVTKKEHCVRYVAGAVHTSAYDRNVFIEQAQKSLDIDPNYPFAVFNSATESRTFTEQDLVRNSRTDSDINAGIMLVPGTSYTIAVYGENSEGDYNVTTTEVVVPKAEINGDTAIAIEMSDITETSAKATVTSVEGAKVVIGYLDPAITSADSDNPFDFEGKSEEEIKSYIVSSATAIPTPYKAPIERLFNDPLSIDTDYIAYAIAIKDGKVGSVCYTPFKTKRPSLTGIAKITAAEIVAQTSFETLTVKVTADSNAKSVRIYAAPTADHAAYADNLAYVMDADTYQNYREEYVLTAGVATAVIDIYHPGDNYYIYASAVDNNGRAGEMVCVAKLSGLDTEYYTTMEEIIEEGAVSLRGTGTVKMNVKVVSTDGDKVGVDITLSEPSENVSKIWLYRLASAKEAEIESKIMDYIDEYPSLTGSRKEVTDINATYSYIDDWSNSFNPTLNALLTYSDDFGGDIIVALVLDTDGKFNICCYYLAGVGVKEK